MEGNGEVEPPAIRDETSRRYGVLPDVVEKVAVRIRVVIVHVTCYRITTTSPQSLPSSSPYRPLCWNICTVQYNTIASLRREGKWLLAIDFDLMVPRLLSDWTLRRCWLVVRKLLFYSSFSISVQSRIRYVFESKL